MNLVQPISWVGNIPWTEPARLGAGVARRGAEETVRLGAETIRWTGNVSWGATARLGTGAARRGAEETVRLGAGTIRWAGNVPWAEPIRWAGSVRQAKLGFWVESIRSVETIYWVELIHRLMEIAFLLVRVYRGNLSAIFSLLLNVLELYADLVEWRRRRSEEIAVAF